jgi:antitoxin component YwqK of YwqJK toxin-antitoxin module
MMKNKNKALLILVILELIGCTLPKKKVSINTYQQKMSVLQSDSQYKKLTPITERVTSVLDVRDGIAYLPKESSPFTGKYLGYYPNGQKEIEENYNNGIKEGLSLLWLANGQKLGETNFKNGQENGLEIYYKNGEKSLEVNYIAGEKNGPEIFYNNGQKLGQKNYINGKEVGETTFLDKDNKKIQGDPLATRDKSEKEQEIEEIKEFVLDLDKELKPYHNNKSKLEALLRIAAYLEEESNTYKMSFTEVFMRKVAVFKKACEIELRISYDEDGKKITKKDIMNCYNYENISKSRNGWGS